MNKTIQNCQETEKEDPNYQNYHNIHKVNRKKKSIQIKFLYIHQKNGKYIKLYIHKLTKLLF